MLMLPELFQLNPKITTKKDVYAFGVAMHYILTKSQYRQATEKLNYERLLSPK